MAGVEWRDVVHNAIDPAEYTPVTKPEEKENYLVSLARINPDKGQHIAIEVAKRLNMPLVLAGKVDVQATGYFEEKIKPNLDGQITWRENWKRFVPSPSEQMNASLSAGCRRWTRFAETWRRPALNTSTIRDALPTFMRFE